MVEWASVNKKTNLSLIILQIKNNSYKQTKKSLFKGSFIYSKITKDGGFMIVGKKKLMSVLFAVFIILTSSMVAYAAPNAAETRIDIQPFWQNTNDVTICLSITDGKAVLSTSLSGYSGVNKITAVAVLERLNSNGTYTEIERWDNLSSDNRYLDWTATRYVSKGYTYCFTFTATVYKNGVGETVSRSISKAG